jgi:hypothetical protein
MANVPTVGRIVHYYPNSQSNLPADKPIPAVITEAYPGNLERVQLHAFHPGLPYHFSAEMTTAPFAGCWMWPYLNGS